MGQDSGIVLVILLAMVVLGGVGIYFYGHSLIGRANFVSDDQVKQLETLPAEAYEEKTTEQDGLKGTSLNQSELGSIQKKMNQENSMWTRSWIRMSTTSCSAVLTAGIRPGMEIPTV